MRYVKYLAAAAALFLLSQSFCFAADSGSLASLVNSHKPIKVYLKDFTNVSGKGEINPADFKAEVEKAMMSRKVVKFEIVKDPAESDVQVGCVITKFQYMEKGPMKPSPSVATLALDAAATLTLNYVEMFAKFTITDTKTSDILWEDTINEYKKHKMTAAESVPYAYDRTARAFLWKSFGKPSN
jgi:hypothetical protein